MALSDAALNLMADALAAAATHVSIHTADPSTTGANEVTGGGYARQAAAWDVTPGGDLSFTAPEAFTGPSGEDALYAGLWDQATTGTWLGGFAFTPGEDDVAFNAAGEYTLNDIAVNNSAS